MAQRSNDLSDGHERIDAYIASSPRQWQVSLITLRKIIHTAIPAIKEDWKWGPNFANEKGQVCGIYAASDHVSIRITQGARLKDTHKLFNYGFDNANARMIKFRSFDEIIKNEQKIIDYLREADVLPPMKTGQQPKLAIVLHPAFKKALDDNRLSEQFHAMAYTHKKEYMMWIRDAKKEETRERRIMRAIAMIKAGKAYS